MTPYCIVVRLQARVGMGASVLEILRELRPVVAQEAGTLRYSIYTALDDPDVVWAHEIYRDRDSYEVHKVMLLEHDVPNALKPYITGQQAHHLALDWAKD